MMNLIDILDEHIIKYPQMEIQDACKIIYQSIFGGGHMIADANQSLDRVLAEYKVMEPELAAGKNCVESIGPDMVRISLDAMKEGLRGETLNRMFVLSANRKKGSIEELEDALREFFFSCRAGRLPFETEEVRRFLLMWKEQEFQMLSHSEKYRCLYRPSYRVAEKVYGEYYPVILEIEHLLADTENQDKSLVVAIDGMAGSGKSTLGAMLKELYGCNLFHMDDFFLQPHQRTEERLNQPGGNVDYERFQNEIYEQLELKKGFSYQKYDCSVQRLGQKTEVPYCRLNIIEGAYSLHPYFANRADLAFFLEVSAETQRKRIEARNGERMLKRFVEEWIPMEERYFDTFAIKEKAILI